MTIYLLKVLEIKSMKDYFLAESLTNLIYFLLAEYFKNSQAIFFLKVLEIKPMKNYFLGANVSDGAAMDAR